MERENEPNRGFLSPPGGKLHIHSAESPIECAIREANEECGIISNNKDWKLIGIVTEKEYPDIGNIMIFLTEYKGRLKEKPEDSIEGKFVFLNPDEIMNAKIPETDKLFIWKFVFKDMKDFFCIKIDCTKNPFEYKIEQK
jgi:8-oxo-dGTP diphosphatase